MAGLVFGNNRLDVSGIFPDKVGTGRPDRHEHFDFILAFSLKGGLDCDVMVSGLVKIQFEFHLGSPCTIGGQCKCKRETKKKKSNSIDHQFWKTFQCAESM